MDFSHLKDKVIVIVGASKGIGRETAVLLANHGVKLVLGARHIEDLQQSFQSENVTVLPVDVRDENSVVQFVNKSIECFKRIDVLINSAGIGTFESILDSSTEAFDNMIAVNLRGTYFTCKHFGRVMREQKQGQILNLASIAAKTALPGNGGYTASKFGVHGLTKVLQQELRREGVRITSVLPGAINSSFWDNVSFDLDVDNMIPVQSIAEHLIYLICQPKEAVVDEITIMPPNGIL
ncbi:SDR family oxidoreductase [Gracilibacillus lacisalsi]|uniref:SDR family oxidoreductase n=1 Tax=Gracilibacillus lacisalsi TaxID=393087 RepID=UPI00037BBA40|nr:SDR family oxidoreductase [Gracilibacillus lacisalsi]